MKYSLTIVVSLLLIASLNSQSFVDENGNTHLWGPIKIDQLQEAPYSEWYTKHSDEYETNLNPKNSSSFEDVTVKIYLGTWCGDTKYLVPKFIKTWTKMGLPEDRLKLIGLHRDDELYKQGPNQETVGQTIHKVPTFVFEKDGKEIGRIVERTVFDLDTDMLQIATGAPYKERYQAVSVLNQHFQNTPIDSLHTKNSINLAYRNIRREVSKSSELNVYGYILKYQGLIDEAEFVFKLNKFLFPYDPNVRDSYGEILMEKGDYDLAKEEYYEVIRLKKEDAHAVNQLSAIEELTKNAKSD